MSTLEVDPISIPISKPPLHLDWLDGVRALAALQVTIWHTFCMNGALSISDFNFAWRFLLHADVAVAIFVVLSGYCLYLPIARNGGDFGDPVQYFIKRARRILPPYYAAILIAIGLTLAFKGQLYGTPWPRSFTWKDLLSECLMLQLITGGAVIDYPVWTICVEWWAYFSLPILAALYTRLKPSYLIAGLGIYGLLGMVCFESQYFALSQAPKLITFFALGTYAAWATHHPDSRVSENVRPITILVYLGVVVVAALVYFDKFRFMILGFDVIQEGPSLIVGPLFMCVLISVGCGSLTWLRRVLSTKPLVFLGRISYSIYLLHAIVLAAMYFALQRFVLTDMQEFWILLAASLPLLLMFSYVFFERVEKPFMSSSARSLSP